MKICIITFTEAFAAKVDEYVNIAVLTSNFNAETKHETKDYSHTFTCENCFRNMLVEYWTEGKHAPVLESLPDELCKAQTEIATYECIVQDGLPFVLYKGEIVPLNEIPGIIQAMPVGKGIEEELISDMEAEVDTPFGKAKATMMQFDSFEDLIAYMAQQRKGPFVRMKRKRKGPDDK